LLRAAGSWIRSASSDAARLLPAAAPFRQGCSLQMALHAALGWPGASPQSRRLPVKWVPVRAAAVAPRAAARRAAVPTTETDGRSSPPTQARMSGRAAVLGAEADGHSSPPTQARVSAREQLFPPQAACRGQRLRRAGLPARVAPPAWNQPWLPVQCGLAFRRGGDRGRRWLVPGAPSVPAAASNPDRRPVPRAENYPELVAGHERPPKVRRDRCLTLRRYRSGRRS
jgi:hypothetical protein